MAKAAMQVKLASYFFLAAVMLQLLSSSVTGQCLGEHVTCDPSNDQCCEDQHLECVDVNGSWQCEHAECENHIGHACDTNFPCCEDLGLKCNSSSKCECELQEDDTCVPNSYPKCCEPEGLACIEVATNVFKCEPDCEGHGGHSCSATRPCCADIGLTCENDKCVCPFLPGQTCVPGVDNCCDLECVAVQPNVYECA